MSERARLRVNLAQSEFEVEGSEAFVRTYAERFDALLDRLGHHAPDEPAAAPARPAGAPALPIETMSLGELLHHLPRSASDVDRMLLAGYVAQARAPDKAFSTGEANALLTEQGIKIGNPSQSVKQNLVARRVFRHQRRYRVSQVGIDHLAHLLGPAFAG